MNNKIIQNIKAASSDKGFVVLLAAVAVLTVLYCLSIALRVHPQEISLVVRYTAFGEAHYYKEHWYYLLQFIVFGLLVGSVHLLLMVKLYTFDRHQAARLIGWITILILVVALAYAHSVLGVAYI